MTDGSAAPGPRGQIYQGVRTGGRSARVREAVLAAVVHELTTNGYETLSLSSVAARADVHLSTVQRRWATKSKLILDVATELTHGMVPDPNLGALRADLIALAQSVTAMLLVPEIITVLKAAFVLPDGELAELRERFWSTRIAVAQAIVDRAVARGELPSGTVGWDIVEPIHATIWMRLLITGLDVDPTLIERTVDRVIANAPTSSSTGRDHAPPT